MLEPAWAVGCVVARLLLDVVELLQKMCEVSDFVVFSEKDFTNNENCRQLRKKSLLPTASRTQLCQEIGQGQRRAALKCITNNVENSVPPPVGLERVC
jgi:hypothetical protein